MLGVLYRPNLFEALVMPLLILSIAPTSLSELKSRAPVAVAMFAAGLAALSLYAISVRELDVERTALWGALALALAVLPPLLLLERRKLQAALIVLVIAPFVFHALKDNKIWLSRTRPSSYGPNTVDHGFSDLLAALRRGEGPYRVAVDQEMMGGPWNGAWRAWKIEAINGFEPSLELAYRDYVLDGLARWAQPRTFGRFDPSSPKFDALNVKYAVVTEANARDFTDHPSWRLVYDSYYKVFERKNAAPRFKAEDAACAAADDIVVRRSQPGRQLLSINARCRDTVIMASERPHRRW